jgi:hypothetical protein
MATGNCAPKTPASWECFDGERGSPCAGQIQMRSLRGAAVVGFGSDNCSTQERFAPHQLVAAGRGELNAEAHPASVPELLGMGCPARPDPGGLLSGKVVLTDLYRLTHHHRPLY